MGACGPSRCSATSRASSGVSGGSVVVIARGFPAAQVGRCSRSSGPREAQEEHGTVDTLDDGIRKVEHRRLRPVDVFEHHDERSLRGEDLEQAPDRPGGVGRERLADAENLRQPVAHGRPVGLSGQPFAERRRDPLGLSRCLPGCLREQFDERRERDAVAVGRGLSNEDRRSFAYRVCERGRQARLAHSGRCQDGHEHARVVLDRVLQRLSEHPQVAVASHQRRLDPGRRRTNAQDPMGVDRLGLPLELDRAQRREIHVAAEHPFGRRGHQHVAPARRPPAGVPPC